MATHCRYVFDDKDKDFVACAICTGTCRKPLALDCLHTFCKSCLYQVMQKYWDTNSELFGDNEKDLFPCPVCQTSTRFSTRNHQMDYFIDELANVSCKNCQFSCRGIAALRRHDCGNVPVPTQPEEETGTTDETYFLRTAASLLETDLGCANNALVRSNAARREAERRVAKLEAENDDLRATNRDLRRRNRSRSRHSAHAWHPRRWW